MSGVEAVRSIAREGAKTISELGRIRSLAPNFTHFAASNFQISWQLIPDFQYPINLAKMAPKDAVKSNKGMMRFHGRESAAAVANLEALRLT